MPTFVAFLRAVNVGGRTVRMADLRSWLLDSGLGDVETHIQSGNVRVTSPMRSQERVAQHLEDVLARRCGFEVTTIVLTPAELAAVADDAAALAPWAESALRRYVTFLKAEPPAERVRTVEGWEYDGERARVRGRAVHWWLAMPSQQARLSNAVLERALGPGTTRDLKVVTALAEKWGS